MCECKGSCDTQKTHLDARYDHAGGYISHMVHQQLGGPLCIDGQQLGSLHHNLVVFVQVLQVELVSGCRHWQPQYP